MSNVEETVKSDQKVTIGKSPRRAARKDHLQSQAGKLTVVGNQADDDIQTDPLIFWTVHPTKPYLVDLREFANGTLDQGDTGLSFAARRALIEQIVPAFQARHAMAAPRTIDTIKSGLRKWWRIFDAIEAEEQLHLPQGALAKRLTSVIELGALHGDRAVQSGMSRNDFHSFVVLADITRLALGLKRPLHWPSPQKRQRQLPVVLPPVDIKVLYHGMKADWHNALDRWALADGLVAGPTLGGYAAGESPGANYFRNDELRALADGDNERARRARLRLEVQCESERVMVEGLGLWRAAVDRLGHADLVRQNLVDSAGVNYQPGKAFNISEVAELLYPNGVDIRSAFYLCLTVGGLNAGVLLDLRLDLSAGLEMSQSLIGPRASDAERRQWVLQRCPFLVQSPLDGEYYIEGWKDRSKSWVSRTYKWKQHLTPGPLLTELIIRTWPLRVALNKRLEAATRTLNEAIARGDGSDATNELRLRVFELTDAVRSPWLYRAMRGISWLSASDYGATQPGQSYVKWLTRRLNKERHAKGLPEIMSMEPRRFRDAYAAWALDYSGGEVLAVMVALDHRSLSTTDGYLDNAVVRARVVKKHKLFSKALFGSLASGNLDPTLLALETRYAGKDPEERSRMAIRLVEYREAVKSRYGIGCRDPHRPSTLAAPGFEADGVQTCTAHRCTLCHENAIITPDAYPGLMLRQAELEIREEGMPMASFVLSSFDAELQNVRTALLPLKESDPAWLASAVEAYKIEIRAGLRRVPGFSVKLNEGSFLAN